MFLLTDIGNYSIEYKMHEFINHTSPNDLMMELKDGIGLRAYGQKDPVVQYRIEGSDMFEQMVEDIRTDVVKILLNIHKAGDTTRRETAMPTSRLRSRLPSPKRRRKPRSLQKN